MKGKGGMPLRVPLRNCWKSATHFQYHSELNRDTYPLNRLTKWRFPLWGCESGRLEFVYICGWMSLEFNSLGFKKYIQIYDATHRMSTSACSLEIFYHFPLSARGYPLLTHLGLWSFLRFRWETRAIHSLRDTLILGMNYIQFISFRSLVPIFVLYFRSFPRLCNGHVPFSFIFRLCNVVYFVFPLILDLSMFDIASGGIFYIHLS